MADRQYMGADGVQVNETTSNEFMGAGGAEINETVAAAASFIPYPNPRNAMSGGMQENAGGLQ